MREIALILEQAGFLLYAVPILWSTLAVKRSRTDENTLNALRRFRRFGPLLGLSLGACIFGMLSGIWLDHGAYEANWSTASGRGESAMHLAFFFVWISNIKLEIWTLEPLRKLDPLPFQAPPPDQDYGDAIRHVRRHLMLHSVGLISVLALRTGL